MQNLFEVAMQADVDKDFSIGDHEVDMLLLRFRVDPRVKVNEELFRSKLKAAGGKLPLATLIQDLTDTDLPAEEHIFLIDAQAS
jgi:hypothetical protein